MLHPASLLFVWLGFALGLQWLPVAWLIVLAMACVIVAFALATERSFNLLRRSRWLLLSLAVLYLFATPGEYLSGILGDIGLTYEGLNQGGVQIGRLLAMLASLAVLHQTVGTQGLLTGFHCLLKPFPWREATVVRLMLVLEYAEQKSHVRWREWLLPSRQTDGALPDSLVLSMPRFRWVDGALVLAVIGLLLVMLIRP
jgi:hypothetical protein